MTGDRTKPPPLPGDPDRENAEQDESGTQAQDVAEDALARPFRPRESVETEHGGYGNPARIIPEDTPDLVDRMHEMDRSGRIDMDAFAGEESMDDEDGSVPD